MFLKSYRKASETPPNALFLGHGVELQKDFFRPVSGFSTEKCPKLAFGELCRNVRHKTKHRLVFYSFIVILS